MLGFWLSVWHPLHQWFSFDEQFLIKGTHQPWLVCLSIAMAIVASVIAMQLAGLAQTTTQKSLRNLAIATGSFSLGAGVWAMHFIGMLAFELCTTVHYAPAVTLLSMIPSWLAAFFALRVLSRKSQSLAYIALGGTLIGAGIGVMHYTGMAALQMAPQLRYDPLGFGISIVVAVVLAIAALWIRFKIGGNRTIRSGYAVILSGIVLGGAISGMHYTAMHAAKIVGQADPAYSANASSDTTTIMALTIALVTLCISVLAAAVNALLRYKQLLLDQQTSETRLHAIVTTAVDGIITFNDAGEILEFNHAAEKIFGWSASAVVGQSIRTLAPDIGLPVNDSVGIAKVRNLMATHRNAQQFPIRFAIGKAEVNRESLYIGVVTDISAAKEMEAALRDSEQKFRSLISNIPGVTFRSVLTEQNRTQIEFISDSVEKMSGWTASDFLSGSVQVRDIIHPDDRDRARAVVRQALRDNQSYGLEYRILDRTGQERWASETASALQDAATGRKWIDGVVLDITDSKLRHAEFEAIVAALRRSLNVLEFDLNGIIVSVNTQFLALSGYSREELIGQHHRILCYPEDVAAPAYGQLWQDLREGRFVTGDFHRRGKAGKDIWIQGTYNPILDFNGKPRRFIKFATDLSERRAMEMDLRIAKEKAEQAAIAKSTFLANMSHEIRTPMNAIIGFTEVLLESQLTDAQHGHLTTVNRSARSLLNLLNDILDTAKLEHGAVELEIRDFSLREICKELLATLRLGAQKRGLTLTLDYPAEVGDYFQGDALRIQQILLNLLGNAIKFTEAGSVCLALKQHGDLLEISVADTGIGISEDRLDRIFDPFAQADPSMTRRFGGTGLGTTIARQFVELMGGHIGVESSLGVGSRFWVQLPLPAGKPPQPVANVATLALPSLDILIADDVPQNLELLQLRLGQLGHRIRTAANGLEVVRQALAAPFDVILMDVQMPQMDGLAASREIRRFESQTQRPPVPIVALTASVLEEDRVATQDAGMNGFAVKPIEFGKLLAEIARVTGHMPSVVNSVQAPDAAMKTTLDAADVDWAQGLNLWGDRDILIREITKFVHDTAASLPALRLQVSDYRATAHRVRGVAANLALPKLEKLANELERRAKAGTIEMSDWDALDAEIVHLQTTFPAPPSGAASPIDAHPPGAAAVRVSAADLDTLLHHLQRGELADDAALRIGAALPTELRSALQTALNEFNFDAAIGIVQKLLATALPGQEGV